MKKKLAASQVKYKSGDAPERRGKPVSPNFKAMSTATLAVRAAASTPTSSRRATPKLAQGLDTVGIRGKTMANTEFCDKYLGGYNNVVESLARVLRNARTHQKLSHAELDKSCHFNSKAKTRLPLCSSEEYEKSPDRINSLIFSLAALRLGLKTDLVLKNDVMKRKLAESERSDLADFMRTNKLGTEFSAGGQGGTLVSFEEQVDVFLACRMFDEIDAVATSR